MARIHQGDLEWLENIELFSEQTGTFNDVRALLTNTSSSGGEGAAGFVQNMAISDNEGEGNVAEGETTMGVTRRRKE